MLLWIVLAGMAILLILILWVRLHAFLALLIASLFTAITAGLPAASALQSMQDGMGSTLGYVATIIGLGALLGAMLEATGGIEVISNWLLKKLGSKRSPTAMGIAGLVISIPVFFDVAFILLVPLIYALQRQSKRSLLIYAIPLLAGLALGHAFIPPTPGPIAVAQLLGADLGKVILAGFLTGIPAVLLAGIVYGKYIGGKFFVQAPDTGVEELHIPGVKLPSFGLVFFALILPVLLIVFNTFSSSGLLPLPDSAVSFFGFIGHPFTALIIANVFAWYFLGIRQKISRNKLMDISSKSLMPAGSIILLTGAGSVFKEVLVQTGAGKLLAETLAAYGLPVLAFAFLAAALMRILQGSATVAMITSASLIAPLLNAGMSGWELAALVMAIASGATILSHVNDSGFWLVKQYLGMTEKQTFRSWSVATTIIAVVGFLMATLIYVLG